jgi:hypothetical protein
MIPVPVVVAKNIKNVVGDDFMNKNFKEKFEELKQRFQDLSDLL